MIKIKRFLLFLLSFLLIFSFGIPPVFAATLQEQVDQGYVTWTGGGVQNLVLRANKTYYIGLSGANGGAGGGGYTDYRFMTGDGSWDYNVSSYRYGSSGSSGQRRYYKITVGSADIPISVMFGSAGSSGQDGDKDRSSYILSTGGSSGSNAFGIGTAPTDGSSSQSGYRSRPAYAGGGGGGGGASAIKFNNNNGQILAANGGNGGTGLDSISIYNFNNNKGSYSYKVNGYGGSGGAGGTINNASSVTGVTFSQISESEAAANGVQITASRQIAIGKKIELTGNKIKFTDLPLNAFVVLPNRTGSLTIFQKISSTQLKWYAGSDVACDYTSHSLLWTDFPSYAVNGSSSGSTAILTVKGDLVFVGGDGTLANPLYPEPAGQSGATGGGGGSSIDYSSKFDQISNSLVFAGEKLEGMAELLEGQSQKPNEEVEPDKTPPVIEVVAPGTISTKSSIVLKIYAEDDREGQLWVKVNSDEWREYSESYSVSLSNGLNSFTVFVKDGAGNISKKTVQIFKQ